MACPLGVRINRVPLYRGKWKNEIIKDAVTRFKPIEFLQYATPSVFYSVKFSVFPTWRLCKSGVYFLSH